MAQEIQPGTPLIVDIGEAFCKVGFAGEMEPREIFPTIVGKEKYKSVMVDTSEHVRSGYVGNDAVAMRGVLKIQYVIERGQVTDWNSFYEVLNHVFYNVLRIDTTQHPLVYSEPILYPPSLREHMANVFFSTFQFPSVVIFPSAVMALVNANLSTGLVVEVGEGMAYIVPIHDGEVITYAVNRLPLGGVDVNENLRNQLLQEGHHVISSFSAQKEILRDIKEKLCYVAEDVQAENQNAYQLNLRRDFTLPDGSTIQIGNSRFLAPEILFQPGILGYNCLSIPDAIINSISKCPPELKKALLGNIVLSGGSTKFPGFEKRLQIELDERIPQLGPLMEAAVVQQKDFSKIKPKMVAYDSKVAVPSPSGDAGDNCTNCGRGVEKNDEFCRHCGNKLTVKQIIPEVPMTPKIDGAPEFEAAEEFMDADTNVSSFSSDNIKIHDVGDRMTSTFRGASKLGALQGLFESVKVNRDEFLGQPQIIHRPILKQIFASL